MVKRAPYSSMVAQGWVSKPVNVSRQTWMVGPEYTWYMRCSCIKVSFHRSAMHLCVLSCARVWVCWSAGCYGCLSSRVTCAQWLRPPCRQLQVPHVLHTRPETNRAPFLPGTTCAHSHTALGFP
jgi:hypothetical protein